MSSPKSTYVETASARLPVPDPTELTTQALFREITHLDSLFSERFLRIQTQINERDVQTDKASRDVKSAVDAAFAAAKEAVGEQNKSNALSINKSEAATTKQIEGIFELVRTNTKGADDKISDIKDRLTTIESHSKGVGDGLGWIIGAGGVIVAVVSVVVSILLHITK